MPPRQHVNLRGYHAIFLVTGLLPAGCQTLLVGTVTTSTSMDDAGFTSDVPTTSDASSEGTTGAEEASESGETTVACTPQTHTACHAGDLHWFDSCGAPGDLHTACAPGECVDGACVPPCVDQYVLTSFQCPVYSQSDGFGPGGGESMVVCANADPTTGHMQIIVHRHPGADNLIFDHRPYQVRVSQLVDGPCGPDRPYYAVSSNAPAGMGTDEIAFNFPSVWLPGQTQKAYCVTASKQDGDPGFDPEAPEMASWWYSDQIVLNRVTCD